MANVNQLGQAGLTGWREKVGDRLAPPIAQRTPLKQDQVRALIGAAFFALSAVYVSKTAGSILKQVRGR